jgi:hypothetical protein
MQVRLVITRIPFITLREENISTPFYFEPHLVHHSSIHDRRIEDLVLAIPRIRAFYDNIMDTLIRIPGSRYVEMHHEIILTDEELQQIIVTARQLGIRLRWYVDILPLISEEEFSELQRQSQRVPASRLVRQVLQRVLRQMINRG